MGSFVPVDYDPFKSDSRTSVPRLMPVKYDPFKEAPPTKAAETGGLRGVPATTPNKASKQVIVKRLSDAGYSQDQIDQYLQVRKIQ